MNKIAIIGGGPTSLSIIKNFINSNYSDFEIDVFEPNQLGVGLVYSKSELETSRQSFSSDKMIVFPEHPYLYLNWKKRNEDKITDKHLYPSRKLMGMFLQDLTNDLLQQAKEKDIKINHIKEYVCDIQQDNLNNIGYSTEYKVITNKQIYNNYNAIFLAIGNLSPQTFEYLKEHKSYVHEIWGNNNFDTYNKNLENVLIIGSGLTSIDVLLALRNYGYNNKIIFASRNSLLPRIRGKDKEYNLPKEIIKAKTAKDLIKNSYKFLLNNLNDYPKELIFKQAINYNNFNLEYNYVKEYNYNPLYSFAISLEPYLEDLWSRFSLEEKQYLDKHFTAYFNSIHLPMIFDTATIINNNLEKNILEIKSLKEIQIKNNKHLTAIYNNIENNANSQEINLHKDIKKYKQKSQEDFELVINATGRGLNIDKMDNILINNLIKNKLIKSHMLGGIQVNKNNESNKNFFIVGPLTRGEHFFTYILRENGRKSNEIVNYYLNNSQ